MTPTLRRDGESWRFENIPSDIGLRLKRWFPVSTGSTKTFTVRGGSAIPLDIESFLHRYPDIEVSIGDLHTLSREAKGVRQTQAGVRKLLSASYTPQPVCFAEGKTARNYQLIAAEFLAQTGRYLLADQLGLGKTVSALAALSRNDIPLPALVVVQPHLKKHWQDKVIEFLGKRVRITIINGHRPHPLHEADIYIIGYNCLSAWVDFANCPGEVERGQATLFEEDMGLEIKYRTLIYDEVQELRRPESDKYNAASIFGSRAEYVLGLSATPIVNMGEEAFHVFEQISPGCFGTKSEFRREFSGNGSAVRDPRALGEYLKRNNLILRRTREEVGREMPAVSVIVEPVSYDQAIAAADKSKMIALATTLLEETDPLRRGQASQELGNLARRTTGVAKARFVAQVVKTIAESGEKILLAGWHRAVYDIWLRDLAELNPVMYTGTESVNQKNESVEQFVNGESQVLIISLRSGIGLDGLQHACRIAVIGEMDWSPQIHSQVIGRIHRDGQSGAVSVYYCVSEFGCDPVMENTLGLKKSQARGIVEGELLDLKDQGKSQALKNLAQSIVGGGKVAFDWLPSRSSLLPRDCGDPSKSALIFLQDMDSIY